MARNIENVKFKKYTWIVVRKLKNMENETQTLYDLKYGQNTQK